MNKSPKIIFALVFALVLGLTVFSVSFFTLLTPQAHAENTFVFNNTLKLGMTSPDVKELQKFFNNNGFVVSLSGNGSLNNEINYFGSKTKQAVIIFQTANSLTADGIVGSVTRKYINQSENSISNLSDNQTSNIDEQAPTSPTTPLVRTLKLTTPIMQGNDVKSLQVFLNTHGFPLALSGVGSLGHETTTFGSLTKKAVISFQKANNLIPDGIVGPLTRKYINGNSIPNVISKLPTGCNENTTFSTTTGLLCNTSIKPQYVIYTHHNVVYTLTYTAGSNGTLTGDLSQKVEQKNHGTMVTAVPNTGYHFTNWSDLSTTNPRTDTNVLGNMSVTANFAIDIPNTFTVGISAGSNGSISPSSQIVNYNLTTTFTVTPDSGYSASASGCDGSLVGTTYTTGAITGACTVSATFAPISYTITFDSAGGSAVTSITADYGTSITPPSDPTKAGYTFAGWSPSIPGTMPATSQTITATWGANDNTVSFNGNGNTGGSTTAQSIQTGNTALLTTNGFTRTGYTFTGWNTLANGTGTAYANGANYTMGATGVAIYAEWSINSYTLTFESNGGSAVTAITEDFSTAISAPSAPTKSGYTFSNWYNEVGLSTIHTFDTMGLTTTVYAKWTVAITPITAIGVITGTTTTGSVLTAGALTPPEATVSYQWQSATTSSGTYTDISSATASTYTLVSTDLGKYIKVVATGTGSYSGTVTSTATAVILATFTYNGSLFTYGIVTNPTTGKTWLDRNLGASQVATSSTDYLAYGDLFQWGRPVDGHQSITWTNSTTGAGTNVAQTGQVANVSPVVNYFLKGSSDWSSIDSDGAIRTANWSKTDGTGICPAGFRVPNETEINAERLSWSSNNSAGAFASPLKLTVAGGRIYSSGSLDIVGVYGYYWSSSIGGTNSRELDFYGSGAYVNSMGRAYGLAVRCLEN